MQPAPWIVLLAAAACSGDDSPAVADTRLLIDVQLSDTSLAMHAREPERPCACSFGWTELGQCRAQSDGFECACDPWPASCLEEVAVVDGERPVASAAWDPGWWGVLLTLETVAGDRLSITGCGAEVSVPLPATPRPYAVIEVDDGGLVTWTSEPAAATSLVSHGDGFGGESCHREGGAGELQTDAGVDLHVSVTALAAMEPVDTALGTVRLWSGNGARLSLE